MFHGLKYVFHMMNKRQIHTSKILKETWSSIILSNALPLSLSSFIRLSFHKFGNEFVSLGLGSCLHPTFLGDLATVI